MCLHMPDGLYMTCRVLYDKLKQLASMPAPMGEDTAAYVRTVYQATVLTMPNTVTHCQVDQCCSPSHLPAWRAAYCLPYEASILHVTILLAFVLWASILWTGLAACTVLA